MNYRVRVLSLVLAVCTSLGCAGALQQVVSALPTVIQYVQDAQMILDEIDRAAAPILVLKNDPQLTQQYSTAMDAARQSLQVALRSAEGGQELSQSNVDGAFSKFKEAYAELKNVLVQAQLMNNAGTMSAAPGAANITVVEPLALSRQVQ